MPFTLSHPAAVLLVRRTGLPVEAMVAGSMVPDVPLFVPGPVTYAETHSLTGVVSVDVVLGVVAVVAWVWLVRDALVDLAPQAIRERLPLTAGYSGRQWLLVPVGVALGAMTHVAWDAFTHRGRWGVEHVAWLGETHRGLPGSSWSQYASSVGGLALVVIWALTSLRARSRRSRPRRVPELGASSLVVVVLAGGVLTTVASLADRSAGLHALAYRAVTLGPAVLSAELLALAALWRLRLGPGPI